MLSDREALLAAIIADPDEDTPRLVFADWCDESGDPERAEYIRLSIDPETFGSNYGYNSKIAKERADSLLKQNSAEWLQDYGFSNVNFHFYFDRGFPSTISISNTESIDWAAENFNSTTLTEIAVQANQSNDHTLSRLKLKNLRNLRKLNVHGFTREERLDAITGNYYNGTVTDEGLLHLRDLKELRVLTLNESGVTDAGLSNLKGLTNLRELYISSELSIEITDAGLNQILEYVKDGSLLNLVKCCGIPEKNLKAAHEERIKRAAAKGGGSLADPDDAKMKWADKKGLAGKIGPKSWMKKDKPTDREIF